MKVSERVAAELRRKIADGELKDGDLLGSEAELISMFNVSRPSVREAVRILEAESLVTVVRGARAVRVQRPQVDIPARYAGLVLHSEGATLADVYRARMLVEPAAVRAVATDAWDVAPPALNDIIARERAALTDPVAFGRTTIEFHEALTRLSGNKTIDLLMGMLRIIFVRHADRVLEREQGSVEFRERGIRAHERLVALIAETRAADAEDFWRAHLQLVERTMMGQEGYLKIIDLIE